MLIYNSLVKVIEILGLLMHHYVGKLLEIMILFIIMGAMKFGLPILQNMFKKASTIYMQEPPREIKGYGCCFCGKGIQETNNNPVYITTAFNYDMRRNDDKRDVLYSFAHWHCLYKHVQPSTRNYLKRYYCIDTAGS